MAGNIKSEAAHLWGILKHILLLPITFFLVLIRKRKISHLIEGPKLLFQFLTEARATFLFLLLNCIVYFGVQGYAVNAGLISQTTIESLIWKPSMLLSLSGANLFKLVASMFLHASPIHLLGNMLFLFMLGRIVEKNVGPVDTLLIYLGSGIISLLFHSFVYLNYFHLDIGGIGASGAISGLAAFAILLDPFALTFLVFGIPIPIIIVGWLQVYTNLVGILSPKESNIGYIAHLGGFMAFTVLGFFLGGKDKKKLLRGLALNIALLLIIGAYYFLRGPLPSVGLS